MRCIHLPALCLFVLLLTSAAFATTYYVAPTGKDTNPGTRSAPKTLQGAANIVNPGDTVVVRDGHYTSGTGKWTRVLVLSRSGSEKYPIIFKSEHKWGAVIDGRKNATGHGVLISCSWVTLQDFDITECCHHGVELGGEHNTVAGNHIHHIGIGTEGWVEHGAEGCGLIEGDATRYNVIEGNLIHDVAGHGIYECGGSDGKIMNNVIYKYGAALQPPPSLWGTGNRAIQLAGYNINNLLISNNTLAWGSDRGCIVVWQNPHEGAKGIHNVTIQNNILYRPAPGCMAIEIKSDPPPQLENLVIRNNLVYGADAGLCDEHPAVIVYGNLDHPQLDPQFVKAPASPPGLYDPIPDFHLRVGSPAIGKGTTVLAPTHDMSGTARPKRKGCDIGAFEAVADVSK